MPFLKTDRVNSALYEPENLAFVAAELERRMNTRAFKVDLEPLPFTAAPPTNGFSGLYARELRCCLGIPQVAMASLLKTSSDIVSRVEHGKYKFNTRVTQDLHRIGVKFAADGIVPKFNRSRRYKGGGDPVKGRRRQHPVGQEKDKVEAGHLLESQSGTAPAVVPSPRFATREFYLGMLAGIGLALAIASLILATQYLTAT